MDKWHVLINNIVFIADKRLNPPIPVKKALYERKTENVQPSEVMLQDMKHILMFLQKNSHNTHEIADALEISKDMAITRLNRLVAAGKVKQIRQKNSTPSRWERI